MVDVLTSPRESAAAALRERPLPPRNLAIWMKAMGYTDQRLADELGVSERRIRYWKAGQRAIPPWLPLALRSLRLAPRRKGR